jgi:hypothetical protein
MVMNEQIQNLKDKIWTEEYWTKPNTDKLLPAQLNKFAELIVRECAQVAKDIQTFYDENNDSQVNTEIWTMIKLHFGVEQ